MSTAAFVDITALDKGVLGRITCPQIGQREAGIIQEAIKPTVGGAKGRIILDMTDVTVLGSMGLGMLVSLTRDCKAAGGGLVIFGLKKELFELVKITKLDQFLAIAADQDAAIKKLK